EIAAATKAHNSREVVLGVRPEDIHDGRTATVNGNQPSRVKVDVIENMGNETYVYLTAGDTTFTARMDPNINANPGDDLPVLIDSHKIHLFDPATEKTIF